MRREELIRLAKRHVRMSRLLHGQSGGTGEAMVSLDSVRDEFNDLQQQIISQQFQSRLNNPTINGVPLQVKLAGGDGNCLINAIYLAMKNSDYKQVCDNFVELFTDVKNACTEDPRDNPITVVPCMVDLSRHEEKSTFLYDMLIKEITKTIENYNDTPDENLQFYKENVFNRGRNSHMDLIFERYIEEVNNGLKPDPSIMAKNLYSEFIELSKSNPLWGDQLVEGIYKHVLSQLFDTFLVVVSPHNVTETINNIITTTSSLLSKSDITENELATVKHSNGTLKRYLDNPYQYNIENDQHDKVLLLHKGQHHYDYYGLFTKQDLGYGDVPRQNQSQVRPVSQVDPDKVPPISSTSYKADYKASGIFTLPIHQQASEEVYTEPTISNTTYGEYRPKESPLIEEVYTETQSLPRNKNPNNLTIEIPGDTPRGSESGIDIDGYFDEIRDGKLSNNNDQGKLSEDKDWLKIIPERKSPGEPMPLSKSRKAVQKYIKRLKDTIEEGRRRRNMPELKPAPTERQTSQGRSNTPTPPASSRASSRGKTPTGNGRSQGKNRLKFKEEIQLKRISNLVKGIDKNIKETESKLRGY